MLDQLAVDADPMGGLTVEAHLGGGGDFDRHAGKELTARVELDKSSSAGCEEAAGRVLAYLEFLARLWAVLGGSSG